MNILLTGDPKSGKTTLLNKVLEKINEKTGLLTNEVCVGGERVGFEVITSTRTKATIANISSTSPIRVSKYGVELEDFEKIIDSISNFPSDYLLYIDEIGEMQLFSDKFKKLALKYLDSENTLIGTISKVYSSDFTDEIKGRKDVLFVDINPDNREEKLEFITQLLRKIKKSKRYISEPERFNLNDGEIKVDSEHGNRTLTDVDGIWNCNCDFFKKYNICSHQMASNILFTEK